METSAPTPRIVGKGSTMSAQIFNPSDVNKPFITIIGLTNEGTKGSTQTNPREILQRLAKLQNVRLVFPEPPFARLP